MKTTLFVLLRVISGWSKAVGESSGRSVFLLICEQAMNCFDELIDIGLGDERLRSGIESFLFVGLKGCAGIEDDRSVRVKLTNLPAEAEPGSFWKPLVQNVEIKDSLRASSRASLTVLAVLTS